MASPHEHKYVGHAVTTDTTSNVYSYHIVTMAYLIGESLFRRILTFSLLRLTNTATYLLISFLLITIYSNSIE